MADAEKPTRSPAPPGVFLYLTAAPVPADQVTSPGVCDADIAMPSGGPVVCTTNANAAALVCLHDLSAAVLNPRPGRSINSTLRGLPRVNASTPVLTAPNRAPGVISASVDDFVRHGVTASPSGDWALDYLGRSATYWTGCTDGVSFASRATCGEWTTSAYAQFTSAVGGGTTADSFFKADASCAASGNPVLCACVI